MWLWCRAMEFGKEGYLRLSFATSMETIEKGVERIIEQWPSMDTETTI